MTKNKPPAKKIGKYELWELIGQGAMGAVYRAYDPVIGRTVAIKLMTSSIAGDSGLRDRFHAEARAAGSLQHPNIVTIYDFGEADGHPYIAMEYISGTDLSIIIREKAPLSLREKLDIAAGTLSGLSYAHAEGIVHRDIKPGNIRITSAGQVKIMDFGIARLSDADLTGDGMILGTPNYMAPEQIKGTTLGPTSDLFAVGAVLYELLTFRKPFASEADTTHAVLYRVVNEEPPDLGELVPSLPPAVQTVVDRALIKDPKRRYQTAEEMAADITRARRAIEDSAHLDTVSLNLDDTPILRRPGYRFHQIRKRAALSGAAVLATVGIIWALVPEEPPPDPTATLAATAAVLDPAANPPPDNADFLRDTLISVRGVALALRARVESTGVPDSLLTVGDSLAGTADSLAIQGQYSSAIIALTTATARWSGAEETFEKQQAEARAAAERARQAASRRARRSTPRRTNPAPAPAPTRTSPPAPTGRLTRADTSAIHLAIQELAVAVSARDMVALAQAYPGVTSGQRDEWEAFFNAALNVSLTLSTQSLRTSGDNVIADLDGAFVYEDRDSGRRVRTRRHFLATLRRASNRRWTILRLDQPD